MRAGLLIRPALAKVPALIHKLVKPGPHLPA
jgi:hypothetical protein